MTTDFMIVIRMCMVVEIVRGKHSVRKLKAFCSKVGFRLQQVANVTTWLYFTGYLEVERSDLVEVSCRLSRRRYRKICPFDGKDTSTPSVSKYRYVFTSKNYCCQAFSRLEIRTRKAMHVCNSYLKIDLQQQRYQFIDTCLTRLTLFDSPNSFSFAA